jgi:hypothetical protein
VGVFVFVPKPGVHVSVTVGDGVLVSVYVNVGLEVTV